MRGYNTFLCSRVIRLNKGWVTSGLFTFVGFSFFFFVFSLFQKTSFHVGGFFFFLSLYTRPFFFFFRFCRSQGLFGFFSVRLYTDCSIYSFFFLFYFLFWMIFGRCDSFSFSSGFLFILVHGARLDNMSDTTGPHYLKSAHGQSIV